MMALGAGGIKSCVAGFAGDQFDLGDVKENKRKMSFMNWWFVSISFGTMLSVSCLVWIQITMGWSWGYGIPAVISAVATGAYLIGTPLYRNQKPTGSPLTRVAQVIIAAIRKWNAKLPNDDDLLYEIDDKEYLDPAQSRLPHSNDFRYKTTFIAHLSMSYWSTMDVLGRASSFLRLATVPVWCLYHENTGRR